MGCNQSSMKDYDKYSPNANIADAIPWYSPPTSSYDEEEGVLGVNSLFALIPYDLDNLVDLTFTLDMIAEENDGMPGRTLMKEDGMPGRTLSISYI